MDIPGYRIISKLGSGAMGTVYLAEQLDLERQVAIKVMADDATECEGDPLSARRFKREAQAMAAMRHTGIVRLYAYEHDLEQPYLVMEYLPGGTLRDKLKERPEGLEIPAVTRIARDLLGALAELHGAKVSHRDIKPVNILYRANGEAVLGDLGLVTVISNTETRLTKPEIPLGTLAYMAPETIALGVMGPAGDLYATGITLFEALVGVHPTQFRPATSATKIPDPVTLRSDAPRALCELILALAQADPARRVGSATEALELLERTGGARPPVERPAGERAAAGGAGGVRPPGTRPGRPRDAGRDAGRAAARSPGPGELTGRIVRRRGLAGLLVIGGLLAIAGALVRRSPLPAFDVRAGGRDVTVVTRPAVSDRLLCVYEGSAPLVTVEGSTADNATTFHARGLKPGQPYRAQLLAAGKRAAPPMDLAFRTAVEVEILGAETSEPPGGVWLRTVPQTAVRGAGDPEWVMVGAEPVRIPGRPRELEVRVGDSAPSTIAVTTPILPEDALLDLGVIVGADPSKEKIQSPKGPRPLIEWLAANHIACAVLPPAPDGKPRMTQDFGDYPGAPRRLLGMRLPSSTEREAWFKELRATPVRDGTPSLIVEAEWMYAAGLDTSGDAAFAAELNAWDAFAAGQRPPWSLTMPAPLGLIFMQTTRSRGSPWASGEPSLWLRTQRKLEAISVESLADSGAWESDRAKLYRGLDQMKIKPELHYVFVLSALRAQYFDGSGAGVGAAMADSLGLVRCFAFARATYGNATVIAELNEIAGAGPVRRPGPTWQRLFVVARALRGTRFRKHLTGAGSDAPRIESKSPVIGFAFAGRSSGVQILCTDARPAHARFTPARAGILRTPGPSQQPWASRLVPTTAPLELDLTSAPLLYEELVPVDASQRTSGAVALDVLVR